MPLQPQHIPYESGIKILIWRITETEEELREFLRIENISFPEGLESIKNELRRKQRIATHLLINHLTDKKGFNLTYTDLGKPELNHLPGSISVSHSRQYVGLIYHPELATGIDIEEPDGRIMKIAGRFVNPEEGAWIDINEAEKDYYLLWGAKECVFKAIGGGGINYKEHLKVGKPEKGDKLQGMGTILYTKLIEPQPFRYYFRYLEDYLLVYTIALKPN